MKSKKSLFRSIFALILSLAILSGMTVAVYAEAEPQTVDSGTCGENVSWTLYDNGKLVISGMGEMHDYRTYSVDYSPFYYKNKDSLLKEIVIEEGVTSIGKFAFYDCDGIKNIIIPHSVTNIGRYAFDGCSNLTSIIIPNSVTSISNNTFQYCSGLTSINIPDSVKSIGNSAFYGCSSLTSISIPNGVTSIGYSAFYGCRGLTSISIPNGVTSIDSSTFYGCRGLTSISIPNSVTSIGGSAFYGCSSLTSISIPDSVTSIRASSFSSCSGLERIQVDDNNTVYDSRENCDAIIKTETNELIFGCRNTIIPNSVTNIGESAFYNCDSLISICVPGSVTSIGDSAFEDCSGLTSINIPGSVTSIGKNAFRGCSGLTSINIPDSVTSMGGSVFRDCRSLTSINIPDSVTIIDDYTFYGCRGLTSINIPNSITSIGSLAFSGCSSLTSINIPDSVTRIGVSAFSSCSALTSINISNSVTSIEDSVFRDCRSLKSINIPNSVTSIGASVFSGCIGLTSISIPNEVTSIGKSAFSGCSGLTSIKIPDSVTSIGDYAFEKCRDLTSINIPYRVTDTGNYTFYGCSDLTNISIPDGVTSIGNFTFYGCSSLTSINIPDSLTNIGVWAFENCSNLLITKFPDSIEAIDNTAFTGCTKLKNYTGTISCGVKAVCGGITNALSKTCKLAVNGTELEQITKLTIPFDISNIVNNAFAKCTSLKEVTIGNNIKSIGSNAFANCPLETVYFKGTKAEWDGVCGKNVNLSSADVIFVDYNCGEELSAKFSLNSSTLTVFGSGEMDDYTSAEDLPWYEIKDSIKTVVFDGELTNIGNFAFSGLTALENIEIPETVTSIGASAFEGCTSLNEITVPSSVDKIKENTFKNCTALKTVNLPDGITGIGENAFYNTAVYNDPASYKGNKVLYLGDNRYLIAYGSQLDGQSFNGIVNPNAVLIADGAFRGANCETVQLNEGMKYIGKEAFADSSLKTLYFPEGVEACSKDIFKGCGSLTVNYGSSISDWYRKQISLPENSVVYFTAKTEDGKVSVIYCSDDLPQEIGDISIDENSPELEVKTKAFDGSETQEQLKKISGHSFTMDYYDDIEVMDIKLKNDKGEVQPKAGKSVRVKIKAPDSVREKILELLDFQGDFDELKINSGGVSLNGNTNHFSAKQQKEIMKNIVLWHFFNNGEYMGKKFETITFDRNLELENGYLIFYVEHFSEFSVFTSPFEFAEKEITLDGGTEKKLDYILLDDKKTIRFESSKPSVATVDGSGVVTAKGSGETVITAYYDGVEVGTCTVTVNSPTLIFSESLSGTKVDYMTTVNFSCQVENPVEGATVHWYIDGNEYAEGETCTVKGVKESFMISVKLVAEDGTVLQEKKEQIIKVKNGFFDKLLGLFRKLFGTLKTVNIS